jgi:hypothetical protein
MLPAKKVKDQPTLEEVHELFERWRKGKRGRDPIPPVLWKAAISLAGQHSINRIARHLRLSHKELKIRIEGYSVVPVRAPDPITFLELTALTGVECTIEIEKPTGERMRIKGNCDVARLAREFWER